MKWSQIHDLFEGGIKLPIVEEFYSIQGEGYHFGKAAYFLRIGGCDVGCSWCDSKFAWDPAIHPLTGIEDIIKKIAACPAGAVVVTGGEPLIFDLTLLCKGLKSNNIQTFLETSGTHPLTGSWDWICLSPKRHHVPLPGIYEVADELKVIISTVDDFKWALESSERASPKCKLYLQPEWSMYTKILPEIVEFVKSNPKWEISLQAHKFMRIP